MDHLEKVEKLRERAQVSYEEAKTALEKNGWDLLDAMVYLEKSGKTQGPERSNYSTNSEEQPQYVKVEDSIKEEQRYHHESRTLGEAIRRFLRICIDNKFCILKGEETIVQLPILAVLIIIILSWKISIPVMIIALFFGIRYHLEGKDDMNKANRFMDSAGNAADSFKEGFTKGGNGKES